MVGCDYTTSWSVSQPDSTDSTTSTTVSSNYVFVERHESYTVTGVYGLGADLTDLVRHWANRPTWTELCRRYWTYVSTYIPVGQASQVYAARRKIPAVVPRCCLLYAPREDRRRALPTSRSHRRLVRRLLNG